MPLTVLVAHNGKTLDLDCSAVTRCVLSRGSLLHHAANQPTLRGLGSSTLPPIPLHLQGGGAAAGFGVVNRNLGGRSDYFMRGRPPRSPPTPGQLWPPHCGSHVHVLHCTGLHGVGTSISMCNAGPFSCQFPGAPLCKRPTHPRLCVQDEQGRVRDVFLYCKAHLRPNALLPAPETLPDISPAVPSQAASAAQVVSSANSCTHTTSHTR
jgi:hypothetical protein